MILCESTDLWVNTQIPLDVLGGTCGHLSTSKAGAHAAHVVDVHLAAVARHRWPEHSWVLQLLLHAR